MPKYDTKFLWAKKSRHGDELWLPLRAHMSDSAEIAVLLWENFVPHIVKKQIAEGVIAEDCEAFEMAKQILKFVAFAHDLGKATPIFQSKTSFGALQTDGQIRRSIVEAGFPLDNSYTEPKKSWHPFVSHAILARHIFDESIAVILGGHHGKPPNTGQIADLAEGACDRSCGFDKVAWTAAQEELLGQALNISGLNMEFARQLKLSRSAQVLLSGLVILIDWMASDLSLFPLVALTTFSIDSTARATTAFKALKLPAAWLLDQYDPYSLYNDRFGIKFPRPVQNVILETAENSYGSGIFVVEAPMGEGKTEAALAAAEILAGKTGCRGVYFALPSQATSNAMFDRVVKWVKNFDKFCEDDKYSVRLSHGRAEFKLSDETFIEDEDSAIVHEWFNGRKKGLFADFTVGTIDHVLMLALKQKHLVLRHLGLAGKVVIIDECHAYDVFMESYLLQTLKWLGHYGVPVIVLSATLPHSRRKAVIDAYLNKREPRSVRQAKKSDAKETEAWAKNLSYPLVTYTEGTEIKSIGVAAQTTVRETAVEFRPCEDSDVLDILENFLENGGCAGIIVNTVARAQKIYSLVMGRFDQKNTRLLHSSFLGVDRNDKEQELLDFLGPSDESNRPERLIVVGTQIFEQSMDIDFDVMFSDLCPMDFLLQRVGRLHRHKRVRPQGARRAVCYVMGTEWGNFDAGSEAVYGRYILMRSRAALPEIATLPKDIPMLVAQVYNEYNEENELSLPDEMLEDYEYAKKEHVCEKEERVRRSKNFQITDPTLKSSLVGWLDMDISDDSEKHGEAAVRDGADSIEVIVIRRTGQGELALLPWIQTDRESGCVLPRTQPDEELAKIIAECYLRLPVRLSQKWIMDKIIDALEKDMQNEGIVENWYKSRWLKGTLCLILDGNLQADLCGFKIIYDKNLGLRVEKQGG